MTRANPHSRAKQGDDRNRTGGAFRSSHYLVRGFGRPVIIVGHHPDPSAAWVVPASMPWACSRAVRRDHLVSVHA